MNINDPFGRVQGRRERDYQSLCESLKKSGLINHAAAEQLRDSIDKRCKLGLMVVISFSLILAALSPQLWMFTLIIGALICLWLVNTAKRSREFVNRYIKEELVDVQDDSVSF